MTDTEMILQAIDNLKAEINKRFDVVDNKLEALDTSIGMLAEWAEDVSVVTKIPFAHGKSAIR